MKFGTEVACTLNLQLVTCYSRKGFISFVKSECNRKPQLVKPKITYLQNLVPDFDSRRRLGRRAGRVQATYEHCHAAAVAVPGQRQPETPLGAPFEAYHDDAVAQVAVLLADFI